MYYTEDITATISTSEMLSKYVDAREFIQYCKTCPNYGQKWSCPDYDFDTVEIWESYDKISVLCRKIIYDDSVAAKTYTNEEIKKIMAETLVKERAKLDEKMVLEESNTQNSRALYAGSCTICETCTRPDGNSCRFPERMKYSIESLGGNVALLTEELLNVPLKWSKDGKLPEYFTLVCGLLYKES